MNKSNGIDGSVLRYLITILVHEATKHTPYELVFGKIARIPSNKLLPPGDKLTNYDDYLINLVT